MTTTRAGALPAPQAGSPARTFLVAVGVADVRRDPDPNSELVTQAFMNTTAVASVCCGDWTHVTLSDYEGWIRTRELEQPIANGPRDTSGSNGTRVAVVKATHTPLYASAQGDETMGVVYLSTILPLLDRSDKERLRVVLPGGATAWLERGAINIQPAEAPYPRASVSEITAYARAFLGVPYLWGGTSRQGIDCSGFVQLCYRMGGYILPRDADQQYDFLQHSVTREEIREGDLIFFGRNAITHVAMALSKVEFIHSEGQEYNCVTINSLDPSGSSTPGAHYLPPRQDCSGPLDTSGGYNARLDELVWGIKRVIVAR